jgi:hypothetical protein
VSEVTAACGGGLQAVLGDHVGLILGGEGQPPLENHMHSPLDYWELGCGLAVEMGEQARAMTQSFLEVQ